MKNKNGAGMGIITTWLLFPPPSKINSLKLLILQSLGSKPLNNTNSTENRL